MQLKKLAAVAAMMAAATPGVAFDGANTGASTMFYISIPLDYSRGKKDQKWSAGLQLQGKREYQAVSIDSSMFNFLPMGGLEAKWIVAGVVAAGAAVALGGKDKGTTQSLQTQQTAHQQQIQSSGGGNSGGGTPAPDCPTPVTDPCRR